MGRSDRSDRIPLACPLCHEAARSYRWGRAVYACGTRTEYSDECNRDEVVRIGRDCSEPAALPGPGVPSWVPIRMAGA